MAFDFSRIPIWLRRTPEQQAADDALQARLKSAYGPGIRPSATERQLMRAVAVELSARAQLEHLDTLPDPEPLHVEVARAQLAEARADQGHFAEAAAIHPDPAHCERYEAIAAAIEKPDDETCDCEPEQKVPHPVTGKAITIQNENAVETVLDPRTGQLQTLIRCNVCGDLNVRPPGAAVSKRLDGLKTKEIG